MPPRHPDEAEVLVPAGPFRMGRPDDDLFAEPEERPARTVTLGAFAIDVHPVTNRRFREFVAAGGYAEERWWSAEGWAWLQRTAVRAPRSFGDPALSAGDQPVAGVSWHEAEAFCRFAGRRLPTSAEWERAARGTEGRRFPWGDALPHRGLCNFAGRVGRTTPIGSYTDGVSPCGCHDMAGNVNGWVADVYWAGVGRYQVAQGALADPALTADLAREVGVDPRYRVDRGGGYLTAYRCWEVLAATLPLRWPAESRETWHGFRTARSVPAGT